MPGAQPFSKVEASSKNIVVEGPITPSHLEPIPKFAETAPTPVLSATEEKLVLCIAERLVTKNDLLSFGFAPQNDRPF